MIHEPREADARAWERMAEAWETACPDAFGEYVAEIDGRCALGLCGSIKLLDIFQCGGSGTQWERLSKQLMAAKPHDATMDRRFYPFWWDGSRDSAQARAQFCRQRAADLLDSLERGEADASKEG